MAFTRPCSVTTEERTRLCLTSQDKVRFSQTDQLLYYYSHNQHVIMCFVSFCHCLAVFDDIINAIAHIAGEFDLI